MVSAQHWEFLFIVEANRIESRITNDEKMSDIIPFKGTRYNSEKIKNLSEVVAPPYDVISKEEQEHFYNSQPYNIIRLLLGKDLPGDNEKENKYTRAAHFLKDWQNDNFLRKDEESSIYIYMQEFSVEGKVKRRIGFLALLKLEEFDTEHASIYPHEHTFSGPKEDRTKLIAAIEANLGPIFAIFQDEEKSIDKILENSIQSQPLIDIMDYHGIKNKLWRISDKATIEKIVGLMKDKKLFIADGHHRYEAGLGFSKLKKDPKFDYILTYFTDVYGEGIVILPVHRLISGVSKDILSGLEKELAKNFIIEELNSKPDVLNFLYSRTQEEKRFVLYDGSKFKGLVIKDSNCLDVIVLHNLVIEPLEAKVKENKEMISMDFTKDFDHAISEVDNGKYSVSIMLNPTKVTEVRDVAFSGNRMPQKSTYFYPKVLTGLVINVF